MSHRFDTGLTKPQRTLIRDAVLARLAPLLTSADPPRYITAIKKLPRVLRGEGDAEGISMLVALSQGKAPVIMVALGRKHSSNELAEPLEQMGELELCIYVASAHSRDLIDGRLEQDVRAEENLTLDPGIDTILEHIEERIQGQGLGVKGVKEPRQTDEDEVATFAEYTIWYQRYRVEVERVIDPNRDETILVTSIEGRHQESNIPAGLPDGATDLDPLVTLATLEPETP